LRQLGDKASKEWNLADPLSVDKKIITDIGAIKGVITDTRAAELFDGVDTDNPTLVANEGGFDINASQGPEGSTYLDLGNGSEVFVVKQSSGEQVVYQVENGELGDRISGKGTVDLGNDIFMTSGESPTGASEINFRLGRKTSSWGSFEQRPALTLNSDNSLLTTKDFVDRDDMTGGILDHFKKLEINSFDIQTGEQVVIDGEADISKMSLQQQFDYYADTPQGQQILHVEGNVNPAGNEIYNTDAEKRLFVARVQYSRGEGGPELFNEFTPRRASLSGDELVAYDAAVQDMMNEEALEAIQADLDKWKISTDNADGSNIVTASGTSSSAGWYWNDLANDETIVQFNLDSLIRDYTNPNDAYELVTHELAHSLDNVDGVRHGWVDGIPPGLTAEETELFIAERERLFELAYPGQDVNSELDQDHNTVANNSGFSNYTFRNRAEFFAELTTTFLSSDANAEIVMNASPELYDMLREYYGREDLPPATKPPVVDWPPVIGPPLPPITKPPTLPPITKPPTFPPITKPPTFPPIIKPPFDIPFFNVDSPES